MTNVLFMFSARLSELSDVSTISVTHINDTALNQTVNQSYAPFASVPRRSHAAAAPPDPLDDMDVSIAPPDMFLDGCKVCDMIDVFFFSLCASCRSAFP